MKLLQPLFDTSQKQSKYILYAFLVSIIPAFVLSYGIDLLFPDTQFPEFEPNFTYLLVSVVILGPLIETLLMWPIIAVLSRISTSTMFISIFSAILWAMLHSSLYLIWGLTIFWSFVVFSISFTVWRKISIKKAIFITFSIHALQNAVASIFILIEG